MLYEMVDILIIGFLEKENTISIIDNLVQTKIEFIETGY